MAVNAGDAGDKRMPEIVCRDRDYGAVTNKGLKSKPADVMIRIARILILTLTHAEPADERQF